MYASHNPQVKAGAAWYGQMVPAANAAADPLHPTNPINIAKDLKVPVIGFYGGLDKGIPVESTVRMQEELKKGRSHSEIVVFPNADHGFHADYRPSYNKQSSDEAWAKLQAWFKKYHAA